MSHMPEPPDETAGREQEIRRIYRYEVTTVRPLFAAFEVYGIAAQREESGLWITVSVVAPFSRNREAAERLAEWCAAVQIRPHQLICAVSDFLSQAAPEYSPERPPAAHSDA